MSKSNHRKQPQPAQPQPVQPQPVQPEQGPTAPPVQRVRHLFEGEWHPPMNDFYAVVHLHGAPARVMQAVEQLARKNEVVLSIEPGIELPPDAWDNLPPRLLRPIQKDLVAEDLRGTKRKVMARRLHLGLNTITAYRGIIRKRFATIPEAQCPVWMLIWLGRFPGKLRIPHLKGAKRHNGR